MTLSRLVVSASLGLVACGGSIPVGQGFSSTPVTATCASGQQWTGGNSESELMNPGLACRSCHLGDNFQNQNPTREAEPSKAFFFMGTVFPSVREADLCAAAVPTDTVVEILDAQDVVQFSLPVNAAGNFRSRTTAAGLTLPYKARVKSGGTVNVMASAQMDGDCNACHTVNGLNGAPGRVFLPQ
ncbi:MAG: hypothetical protein Q8L14_29200 [Myxococcales bacterium]|nr:hypothetical protein [Myxococcales bacterium]